MIAEGGRVPEICDRIVGWGLAGLVAFTPLAFGTVEAWSYAILEGGVVALILVFVLGRAWNPGPPGLRFPATGLGVPLALFLAYCALQMVPLPLPLLQTVAPGPAAAYAAPGRLAAAGFEAAGAVAPEEMLKEASRPARRPISLDPGATWSRTRLLAVLTGLFFLTAWWADRPGRILFLLVAVVVVGFLTSVQGLVQYLTWNGRIFWLRQVPPSSVFGPFVNHNHFAAYVGMVIPAAVALAFHGFGARRGSRSRDAADLDDDGRGGVPGRDRRIGQIGLALFASAILGVALVFSLSRGGILSSVISLGVLFVLLRRRISSRIALRVAAVGVPLLVIGLVFWIGAAVVAERWGQLQDPGEASLRSRLVVWRTILEASGPFLRTGAGLGAFEVSFAPHTPAGSSARWDQAHNDYLQLLWETGLAGAALFVLLAWTFIARYAWPAMRDHRHPLDVLRAGVAVALLSIALHSCVDFNLQIGANGFLCSLLAGLLVALTRLVPMGAGQRPWSSAEREERSR